MNRHNDEDAVAAMIVLLFIGVFIVLGWILSALVTWITEVHQRAGGHAAIPLAWITLLISGGIALLLGLGHLTTAAGWTAGVGFTLYLLLLAIADVWSRNHPEPKGPTELSVEDVLVVPWWDDGHERVS